MATKINLEDAAQYAVTALRFKFIEGKGYHSLGERLAYAALCSATDTPLNDEQKELLERHSRNGKIFP